MVTVRQMGICTFTGQGVTADDAIAHLDHHGYEVGAAEPFERLLLDTFDRRLAKAGLRLAADLVREPVLTISAPGTIDARAVVGQLPRFARDLPAGPVRTRLAPLIDVRALLPALTLTGRHRAVGLRNAEGHVLVRGHIYEHLTVEPRQEEMPTWTVEVVEIAGYPKPAQTLRGQLAELGLAPCAADTFASAQAASGTADVAFDASPRIPLPPAMPALEGFAAVLDHLADAIEANWEHTVADVDPEFLHDLRVAIRRTRSVLGQAKHVVPADVRAHFRAEFKWLGDVTTPARDLDVYVLEWEGYVEGLGEEDALEPVLAEIKRRQTAAHADLAKALRDDRALHLLPAWRQWLAAPRSKTSPGRHGDDPLGQVVRKRVHAAQKQLLARGRPITADTPGEVLHDLRKDAKKLRYLLECFGGVLAAKPRKTFVKRLKSLQDNLGEHQDAEVHIAQLHQLAQQLASTAPPETLLAMGRLVHRLEERRQASRGEFESRFRDYDSKATSDTLAQVLDVDA